MCLLGAFPRCGKRWAGSLGFGLFAGSFEPLNSRGNTGGRQRQDRATKTSEASRIKILNFHAREVIIFAYQKKSVADTLILLCAENAEVSATHCETTWGHNIWRLDVTFQPV